MPNIIFLAIIVFGSPLLSVAHGSSPDNFIIRMTADGFEPREMTVTEGDEILFINNSDRDRWPASNFHPTHTLYQEFDVLKGIPPGESWKFKFEKAGTWRMHDHLFPHLTGTIVVLANKGQTLDTDSQDLTLKNEENPTGFWEKIKNFFNGLWQKMFGQKTRDTDIDTKLLREFKNRDEKAKYAWLENRAEIESPEIAWLYVKAAYSTPDGVVGNPHNMAHLVGQIIYKKYGFNGLNICEPIFAFGCYHGLMEVAFDKNRPEKYTDNLSAAENGCRTLGNIDTPSYWSCIHGMGHGIATFRDHALEKSLEDCDLLDKKVRTYCHDGVFMELSISAPPNFYKKENPVYPCDIVGENYKTSCARSQVQVMRLRFKMDTDSIAKTCIGTKNAKIIYHCVDALGYFIAQASEGKSSKIVSDCQTIKDAKQAAQCMSAAAGELIFQNYIGWRESVKEICDSLSGQYQTDCQKRIEQVKQSYGRN